MAVGSDNLIDEAEIQHEHLVNNFSVNSFMSENQEFTITRSFGDRKYSTMCFKPSEKNTVDIVITQGEYPKHKPEFILYDIGSQDIRRKYSKKAKLGVTFVFIMLLVMLVLLVFCLLTPPPGHTDNSNPEITAVIEHANSTFLNSTHIFDPALPVQTTTITN